MIKLVSGNKSPIKVGRVKINSECREVTCDCGAFANIVDVMLANNSDDIPTLYLKKGNVEIPVTRSLMLTMEGLVCDKKSSDLFETGNSAVDNDSIVQLQALIFKLSKEYSVIIN